MRRPNKLYRSAKISDYQFKKVLWHFALDDSAAETASHVKLSTNSIAAIHKKLRKFFYDFRLFRDPYSGRDPREGLEYTDFSEIEAYVLTYHLERVGRKRSRLDAPLKGPDYHFAESNWRFDFFALMNERGAELTAQVMNANLMEFIRRFGPVGRLEKPSFAEWKSGQALAMEQLDRMNLWLERNSVKFRDPDERIALRAIRDIKPED